MSHTFEEKLDILDRPEMKLERQFAFYDPATDPREVPRYAVSEVTFFLHIPTNTLRSWVSGRTFPRISGESYSAPVIEPADGEGRTLSFYNLIEAHILKSTRQTDEVPMRFIRAAIDYVNEKYPAKHPLINMSSKRLGVCYSLRNSAN